MEYEIVRCKRENLQKYSEILSEVFPDTNKYTSAFLEWQYYQNPAGEVVGFDAFYNGQIAAHYVAIPVIYNYKGELIKGLLSLNTATKKQHQGKGLFIKLATACYDAAANEGYKFVIGVANQNSTHGFLKKLDFELIGGLDVKIYLGSLSKRQLDDSVFKAHWDDTSLNWRIKNPEGKYKTSGKKLFSDTHIGFIKCLMSLNQTVEISGLKTLGFNPVKMAIGFNLGKPSLSINLPDKFKPSPLNLIFRNISGQALSINKTNCYFEAIDFDAY